MTCGITIASSGALSIGEQDQPLRKVANNTPPDMLQTEGFAPRRSNQLNTPRLSRNFRLLLEISVRIADGIKWKDGDTMHWWVLLTGDQGCILKIGLPGTHEQPQD
jgi:hypothetical protein